MFGLHEGPNKVGRKSKKGAVKVEHLRNLNEPDAEPVEEDKVGTMMGPEMKLKVHGHA